MMTSQEVLYYFLENAHPYFKKLKKIADREQISIIADPQENFAISPDGEKIMIGWFMEDAREENGGEFKIGAPIRAILFMLSRMPISKMNDFLEHQIAILAHELSHVFDYKRRGVSDGRIYPGICPFSLKNPCLLKEVRASLYAKEILKEVVSEEDLPRFIEILKNSAKEYFNSSMYDFCHNVDGEICNKNLIEEELKKFFEK